MSRSPREAALQEAARWLVRHDRAADDRRAGSVVSRVGFQEWLASDPEHRKAYEELQRLWLDTDEMSVELRADPASSAALAEIAGDPPERTRRWLGWAAAATIAAAAAIGFTVLRDTEERPTRAVTTRTAEMREVALADGSRIHLNAESSVRISMKAERREIELLRGEAVFSVARDPDRPFVVMTDHGAVEAIGTEFEVRDQHESVKVLVLEGRVLVTPREGTETAVARSSSIEVPSASVAQLAEGAAISRLAEPSEIERSRSWRQGVLEFDDIPLSEVILDLEPYVRGSILIKDESLASMRVGGLLHVGPEDDPIASLAEALPLQVTRIGKLVTILRSDDSAR